MEQGGTIECVNIEVAIYRVCEQGGTIECVNTIYEQGGTIVCEQGGTIVCVNRVAL